MVQIVSAQRAAEQIPDGAWIGLNAFLALSSPFALHDAIHARYRQTGHPKHLNIYAPCGFGCWDETRYADQYVVAGAVDKVVTSHYPSIPGVQRMARENKIEAYCMPLGVMAQCVRAAAAGQRGYLSKVGLHLFVDPRVEGPAVNDISHEEWVKSVEIEGEEFLYYRTPRIDVALIKGTSVDPMGNISFTDECVTVDALALAQATKANGGKVIVQVERVSHTFERPRSVIIPGILVDLVVVEEAEPLEGGFRAMSGGIHVPTSQMDYWMERVQTASKSRVVRADPAQMRIGRRAAQELRSGQTVNIGVGIPEMVGKYASENGILRDIVLTVESGGIGGLPTPGVFFGATLGADCIVDMAQQFDFYDGGGLDICFMGALEVDRFGNVNAHKLPDRFVGIGGFANITGAAKTVVFCVSFTAQGLKVSEDERGNLTIDQEGAIRKFQREIKTISFSARNALERGQTVLYVTERCVLRLTEDGLRLIEVAPGIDENEQIRAMLDFELAQ